MRCSDRIISGAEPTTPTHFQQLAAAGVKTIISVDGMPPRRKLAKPSGLRYVHIPIGYDGISAEANLAIAGVVRNTTGKIFVHCHHGKHRGPAAAAIACLIEGTADQDRAKAIMTEAGTNPEYLGLWHDVGSFRPITDSAMQAALPVKPFKPKPLAVQMATLQRHLESLQQPDQPTARTIERALLIAESFREFVRAENHFDDEYRKLEIAAKDASVKLYEAVKTSDRRSIQRRLLLLKKQCTDCHAAYRN